MPQITVLTNTLTTSSLYTEDFIRFYLVPDDFERVGKEFVEIYLNKL